MEKFKKNQVVYFFANNGPAIRAVKAVVLSERFNGGNGGYYDIQFIKNGITRTVPAYMLRS